MFVLMFAPLGLVFFLSWRIERLQATTARPCSSSMRRCSASRFDIFLVYTEASLTRVFFISAASFGALSLWGYTTQRNLIAMGSFLIMGLFGIIIAMLVNIFLQSSALDFVISVVGVRLRRPHRLGHAEDQGKVRPDG